MRVGAAARRQYSRWRPRAGVARDPVAARRSGIMAAAEERSPGDQEEEEEEVVSATAEACALAVMAAPAVCGEGSRDAARGTEASRAQRPRLAPGRAEPGRGWPQPYLPLGGQNGGSRGSCFRQRCLLPGVESRTWFSLRWDGRNGDFWVLLLTASSAHSPASMLTPLSSTRSSWFWWNCRELLIQTCS